MCFKKIEGGNCCKDASLAYKRHTTPYTGAVQAVRSTQGDGETYLSITAVVSPLKAIMHNIYEKGDIITEGWKPT